MSPHIASIFFPFLLSIWRGCVCARMHTHVRTHTHCFVPTAKHWASNHMSWALNLDLPFTIPCKSVYLSLIFSFFFFSIPYDPQRWAEVLDVELHYWSVVKKQQLCKSKPQWGTITHQSGWLLSKSLQAINAWEGVEKREPSYTVGGDAN